MDKVPVLKSPELHGCSIINFDKGVLLATVFIAVEGTMNYLTYGRHSCCNALQ